jgi:hypothetical protein
VPSQQLQGHLQTQHSADIHKGQTQHIVKDKLHKTNKQINKQRWWGKQIPNRKHYDWETKYNNNNNNNNSMKLITVKI